MSSDPTATTDLPPSPQVTMSLASLIGSVASVPASNDLRDDTLPIHIDRFEIREKLGEGAFGIVYRAFDPQLNRDVALKVAKPEQLSTPERKARFFREAQSAAKLRHANIVQVHEAGQDGERHFIVQGFINGPSLDRVLEEQPNGRLAPEQAVIIVRKLAEALAFAHQRGIVHRDVKPANAMLETSDNGAIEPVLTDFGLAAVSEAGAEKLTQDGRGIMGTPAYMAPEQIHGNAGPASDQYSLGATFYELMTGKTPFEGSALQQISRHMSEPVSSPRRHVPSIPRDLETICLKCLEKQPSARYANCAELADDLGRWQKGEPVVARRLGLVGRMAKWSQRNPVVAGSLLMVILSVTLGAGFALRYGIRAEKATGELEQSLGVQTKLSENLKDALGTSEQRDRERKQALRESKERQYLADLRLDSARLRDACEQWEQGNVTASLKILDACRPELRGWEYAHLRNRFEQAHFTLRRHTQPVSSVCFSPDGTRILTGSWDHTTKVWDAHTGEVRLVLTGHSRPVTSVGFSPDGRLIVTGSNDNTAKVWDARTGEERFTLRGHTAIVSSVSFSPDGTRIATGSFDRTAKVWDATTGKERFAFTAHKHIVSSVSFSPDGGSVVTASRDNTAKVWDATTGEVRLTFKGHSDAVTSVSFSPDGTRIVTGSEDDTAKVWDSQTGEERLSLDGSNILRVSFSPDGMGILTGSGDEFGLLTGDNLAKLWDARTGELRLTLTGHTAPVMGLGFSPDGTRIVTGSEDATAKVWDSRTGEGNLFLRGHGGVVTCVHFSPDGERIVTGSRDSAARVWDVRTGEVRLLLEGHTDEVTSANFSPDGTRIVTGSEDNMAKVWDLATGKEAFTLRGHSLPVRCVSFSPDGKQIASGSDDKTVRLWDARTGRERLNIRVDESPILSVCFSPDGTRIVTGGRARTGKVLDAQTGELRFSLAKEGSWITCVCHSPDGTLIGTGSDDGTAKVWDARTGEVQLTLRGHANDVNSVSFSPDGMRIVTGSDDWTAKVWDARTGEERFILKGHTLRVTSATFSPDGTRIVTGSADQTARVWDGAGEWVPDAERRRDHLSRIARFDAFRHAREIDQHNDAFRNEYHLRLLIQHAPDHLEWHERRAKALTALKRDADAQAEEKIIASLKASPPELIAAPHLEPLPPPGPRAKIKFHNPTPPNFDE